ncbi:MAG: Rid family detoxifying hydrolase [Bacteroidetes bacterium]|jgi:2-iminobutanoate/2-iminopropanoate deaminase|nr:Rid family detoxifying hydrolase [Bacteroidota bacterium]MDA0972741.1 Rid family detoxifying hydrolase [Bacteroidota bacterium]
MKQAIFSKNAPAPIGPYSQGIRHGQMIFLSGQVAIDPATGDLVMDSIEAETRQVMANIKALLDSEGLGFDHVVKSSIFLSDMALFNQVNAVYATYFDETPPARETVAVAGLPKGVNVEISVTAIRS